MGGVLIALKVDRIVRAAVWYKDRGQRVGVEFFMRLRLLPVVASLGADACNEVLIADTGVNATWLELIEVGESCVKFFLGAFKVLIVCLESLLFILLIGSVVLD